MNTIQIYDLKTDDSLLNLADKLNSAGANISIYNIHLDEDTLKENVKAKRLYDAYGEKIFPITMINGEIVKVEKNLSHEQIIMQTELSMKKLIKAGIEINNQCEEKSPFTLMEKSEKTDFSSLDFVQPDRMCDTNKRCGGCKCLQTGCSSCNKKKNCSSNQN